VTGGGTYLSSGDRRIVFGLGDRPPAAVSITVLWSDRSRSDHASLEPGRYHVLRPTSGVNDADR
jgi:hypothetical protein